METTRHIDKVHAKIEKPVTLPVELFTILDTGSGPNFNRNIIIFDEMAQIMEHGELPRAPLPETSHCLNISMPIGTNTNEREDKLAVRTRFVPFSAILHHQRYS